LQAELAGKGAVANPSVGADQALLAAAQAEGKQAAQQSEAKVEESGLSPSSSSSQADVLNQWSDQIEKNAASRSKLQGLLEKHRANVSNFRDPAAAARILPDDQRLAMQDFIDAALQAGKNINRNSMRALRGSINQLTATLNAYAPGQNKAQKKGEAPYNLTLQAYEIWQPAFDAFNDFGIPGLVPLIVRKEAAGGAQEEQKAAGGEQLDDNAKKEFYVQLNSKLLVTAFGKINGKNQLTKKVKIARDNFMQLKNEALIGGKLTDEDVNKLVIAINAVTDALNNTEPAQISGNQQMASFKQEWIMVVNTLRGIPGFLKQITEAT
jgi:hypothetical protein